MTDDESGMVEPDIVINGVSLTFPEAMTLRVALGSFQAWLSSNQSRAGLGRALAAGYERHAMHILEAMLKVGDR